jgi:hypothetical protein
MYPSLAVTGAFCFGVLIGWYVYYINRHRKESVKAGDLVTIVGVLGGGTILTLFPAGSSLFGAYGIGLVTGFFAYFLILVVLVWRSENFTREWFLDGRRKDPPAGWGYPPPDQGQTPMGDGGGTGDVPKRQPGQPP